MSALPGKVLALDYGRSRIGVAICDPLGLAASPREPIDGRDPQRAVHEIDRLCEEEEVALVLLGLPLAMDGSEGLAVEEVRRFRDRLLARRPGLAIEEVDERLSSKGAHALLKDAGVRHRERKRLVDSTAAAILLRTWLTIRRRS